MKQQWEVHVKRRDEVGSIRWTDSPCSLHQASDAAEKFLRTAVIPYEESDITITDGVVTMTLQEAKQATTMSQFNKLFRMADGHAWVGECQQDATQQAARRIPQSGHVTNRTLR